MTDLEIYIARGRNERAKAFRAGARTATRFVSRGLRRAVARLEAGVAPTRTARTLR